MLEEVICLSLRWAHVFNFIAVSHPKDVLVLLI